MRDAISSLLVEAYIARLLKSLTLEACRYYYLFDESLREDLAGSASKDFKVSKRTSAKLAVVVSLLSTIVASLIVGRSHRERPLIDVAVPALTFAGPNSYMDYTLLSDKTALVLYQNTSWQAFVYQLSPSGSIHDYRLERAVNSFPDGPRSPSASPNGQWLAWYSDGNILVSSTDGTRHFEINQPEKCFFYWTQDSKQLVQFFRSEPSGNITRCVVTSVADHRIAESFKVQCDFQADIELISITSAHQMLVGVNTSANSSSELDLEDIGSKTPIIKRYNYDLPRDLTVQDIVVSPNGRQVCWLMESKREPSWLGWLHRWISFSSTGETHAWSLWISNVNGGQATEIGYIQGPASDTSLLSDVRWTPSGQHLGYRYKDKIWMVPTLP